MPKEITYGIIGDGRVSKHFQAYFAFLSIPFVVWSRSMQSSLEDTLATCDLLLIAIKDDAIESFILENPIVLKKPCVHFGASVLHDQIQCMHPYFNFTDSLFSLETYQQIPFVVSAGKYTFEDIFPKLTNPHYAITPENQARYHSLCVMTGNFPTMIWQETANEFSKLGLPSDLSNLYIKNVTDEFLRDSDNALTGPFARKDIGTIEKNIDALQTSYLQKVYIAFKEAFLK